MDDNLLLFLLVFIVLQFVATVALISIAQSLVKIALSLRKRASLEA